MDDLSPWLPPPRVLGGCFTGPINICTWNSQGLFAARLDRAREKSLFLIDLAASVDVLVVQEAHCCRSYSSWVDEKLSNTHISFWSSLGSSPVGGVGFLVSKKFIDKFFTSWHLDVLLEGRIASLRLDGPAGALQIYNVHCDHSSTTIREGQLHLLANHRSHSGLAHFILAGDEFY